jgi:hypothetical protein
MSIPTALDSALADVDNIAGGIMVSLRTMGHADPKDLPRMRQTLRERLQTYVDAVMAAADVQQ